MARPHEFLDAKTKDEAERIWREALRPEPLAAEPVALDQTLGRVLAADLRAACDVPPFDRAIVDGYAVVAADTFGAGETAPARLVLHPDAVLAGVAPSVEVSRGGCVEIATGGVLPRGANAVQMVERTDRELGDADDGETVLIYKPVTPGQFVQATGSDLRAGDLVFPAATRLSSRETGVLAALGLTEVRCVRRPRVAILSTGDELVAPGGELAPGQIFDANSRVIADAVHENGGAPEFLGIVPDDEAALRQALADARRGRDAVILSGGTSKGTGDLSFRLIDEAGAPGILVHGVQVKPGKPVVLAAWDRVPVVVLPGFPTSAILTFNLFVRPVLRRLAGLPFEEPQAEVEARVPQRLNAAPGRYEYKLVNLVRSGGGDGDDGELAAYPVPKGSGSISAFADADGYLEIPESRDQLLAGERATVRLLSHAVRPADLVFAGSQCQGIDLLLGMLRRDRGLTAKTLNVGSRGGIGAVVRGEADVAGVHLVGADGRYNLEAWHETDGRAALVHGYRRRQGLYYRADDFAEPPTVAALIAAGGRLINRPRGTGTRALLESRLGELEATAAAVPGFDVEARSHAAAAAAVASGRADWSLGIEAAARRYGLGFAFRTDEDYDLLVAADRQQAEPVRAFLALLGSAAFRDRLTELGGYATDSRTGAILRPGRAA